VNALERFFDGAGDDDGLCESDEACVYSPNIGAYQGEGDANGGSCTFTNGAVRGVTLVARADNGA
jgi:hypothetical protein